MPPGAFTNGRAAYLYRGVKLTDPAVARMLSQGVLRDRGFIAVSRRRAVAEEFGDVVLRIDVFGIPRGTPWLWFSDAPSTVRQHREYNRSEYRQQAEVLLPPGVVRIKGGLRRDGTRLLADAVYMPDDAYAPRQRRRGAPANWNTYPLPPLF